MRLLQSILPTRYAKPRSRNKRFWRICWDCCFLLPGHATFRHLSRYRAYHERTLARWYAGDFDFVTLNKAAILRYVMTDGYDSTQKFLGGVRALGLAQMGTRRLAANLRDLYPGPHRSGPGRPNTDDGKGNWDDLARFDPVETDEDDIVLYHQVLKHVQVQCNLQVVLGVDTQHHRRAVLLSTDVDLDALSLYRYDKARFHSEFLFRDAKQFTGLTDGQARSHATLNFHFNASLSAITLAKLDARQPYGEATAAFSLASLKRRALNQHLIERLVQHLAAGHRLEKSSPDDEALCNYGIITETAA